MRSGHPPPSRMRSFSHCTRCAILTTPGSVSDLDELVKNVPGLLEKGDLQALAELASDLGAADTAAPFLTEIGCPPIGRGSTGLEDLRAWRLRTQPLDGTAVSWIEELRRLPKRAWPRYIWYAAVLSEQELRLQDSSIPEGSRAVWAARGRRLRRGLAAMPAAVRSVRRSALYWRGRSENRGDVAALPRRTQATPWQPTFRKDLPRPKRSRLGP